MFLDARLKFPQLLRVPMLKLPVPEVWTSVPSPLPVLCPVLKNEPYKFIVPLTTKREVNGTY